MSDHLFGILDLALGFGAVLGLAAWQLWVLRRDRRREEARRRAGPAATGDADPGA
ncbi:hypothetical protein [Methylobacterium sp. JK268]